ncbi:MAG TPA: hypothetical protein VGA99_05325 [bacterium]
MSLHFAEKLTGTAANIEDFTRRLKFSDLAPFATNIHATRKIVHAIPQAVPRLGRQKWLITGMMIKLGNALGLRAWIQVGEATLTTLDDVIAIPSAEMESIRRGKLNLATNFPT